MSQIKLDYLSVTSVRGNDAESFLQAQLTADLTKLGLNAACFAAFCRPTGNVMAVLLVIRHEDGLSLVASADLMGDLVAEMSRFILRADVKFEQQTRSVFACPDLSDETQANCVTAGKTSLAYSINESDDVLTDALLIRQWRTREIRAGLTWLNPETSGQFIPQMLGLEQLDALSFRKGCFPGQEVIARVRYLGRLKRRPVLAEVEYNSSLKTGTKLEVSGENELSATAVIADMIDGPEGSTCFLVARVPEGSVITSVRLEGQQIDLKVPAQA